MDITNSIIQLVTSVILLSTAIIPLLTKKIKIDNKIAPKAKRILILESICFFFNLIGTILIYLTPYFIIGIVICSFSFISYLLLFVFNDTRINRFDIGTLSLFLFITSVNVSFYHFSILANAINKIVGK